jgi:uncharacterized membrane protein YeaQ/YmgE (transglycosylase-associated protein family)
MRSCASTYGANVQVGFTAILGAVILLSIVGAVQRRRT